MIFEQLSAITETNAGQNAGRAFVEQQKNFIANSDAVARQAAADEAYADNLKTLETYIDPLCDDLQMSKVVEDLNQFGFGENPLQARPLTWLPHAAATIDQSGAVADGVKAIRGWAISTENDLPQRFGTFVGLYAERRDGSHSVPMFAIASLYYHSKSGRMAPKKSVEHLLKAESAPGFAYRQLCADRETLELENPDHAEQLTRYYHSVKELGLQVAGGEGYIGVLMANWLVQHGVDRTLLSANPHTINNNVKLSLEQQVLMADYILKSIATITWEKSGLIEPAQLSTERRIYESAAQLSKVDKLFAPGHPEVRKGFGKGWFSKVVTPAMSPGHLAADARSVYSTAEARRMLADGMDAYYVRAWSKSSKSKKR